MTGQKLLHPMSDAAEVIGVGRSTLYSLIADGKIHAVKVGRRTFITHEELERFVRDLAKVA